MFNPTLSTQLQINGSAYSFSPHPAVSGLVWGQEGRRAIVYRIVEMRRRGEGEAYALKVFRPVHRRASLVEAAAALTTYSELPGMRVAEQTVLTRETYPDLLERYEDLEYAMVMPWIEGATWFDHLNERRRLTLKESRKLAMHMARILSELESEGLAHCDLSSANVIIDPSQTVLHLVDVEDFYGPDMPKPPRLPAGTPGYQHSTSHEGQWTPLGDRFAGAILIGETLGWAHPAVRTRRYAESYFDPSEMQKSTTRFRVLRGVLRIHDGRLANLFEQAWRADTLEACPPLSEWYEVLQDLPLEDPVATWQAIETSFYETRPEPRWRQIRIRLPSPDRILAALIMTAIVIYMVSVFLSTLLN
jgi:hypothetical protein